MKVYVDELPKSCEECPCCNECMDYGISCNLDGIKLSYYDYAKKRHINCPLQSLADYTKQVRKEVVDRLAISLATCFSSDAEFTRDEILDWLQKVKDQIQGETK